MLLLGIGTAMADWREKPWTAFTTRLNADHPDVGKIWSVADTRDITPDELIFRLAKSRNVLIGEIHDNPDHHRLQAWIIAQLAARGRNPAVVMEMIGKDSSEILQAYLANPKRTPEGLGEALKWAESGWPEWKFYQPIAEAAFAANLSIKPGDAPRAELRGITKDGPSAIPPETVKRLRLDHGLSPGLEKALHDEIIAAHCNMLPEKAMPKFVFIQRLRDAHLAEAMEAPENTGGAVLIAGAGHVRRDRAVPVYLQSSAAVVVLAEAHPGEPLSAAYGPEDPAGKPAADYIWLTPGMERPDPCEEMRKAMAKKKT